MSDVNNFIEEHLYEELVSTISLTGASWSVVFENIERAIRFIISHGSPGLAEDLGDVRDLLAASIPPVKRENIISQ